MSEITRHNTGLLILLTLFSAGVCAGDIRHDTRKSPAHPLPVTATGGSPVLTSIQPAGKAPEPDNSNRRRGRQNNPSAAELAQRIDIDYTSPSLEELQPKKHRDRRIYQGAFRLYKDGNSQTVIAAHSGFDASGRPIIKKFDDRYICALSGTGRNSYYQGVLLLRPARYHRATSQLIPSTVKVLATGSLGPSVFTNTQTHWMMASWKNDSWEGSEAFWTCYEK